MATEPICYLRDDDDYIDDDGDDYDKDDENQNVHNSANFEAW